MPSAAWSSSTRPATAQLQRPLRWEYTGGSDLFVVYSDGRDTLGRRGFPELVNRTFVVKLTRLWRF